MPSVHYDTLTACLQENLDLLTDDQGNVPDEDKPFWNLSNALLALSDVLRDEFDQLHVRLTNIERAQQR
jgi:hypothetical protein